MCFYLISQWKTLVGCPRGAKLCWSRDTDVKIQTQNLTRLKSKLTGVGASEQVKSIKRVLFGDGQNGVLISMGHTAGGERGKRGRETLLVEKEQGLQRAPVKIQPGPFYLF